MRPLVRETQLTLDQKLEAAHITVRIPVEAGRIAIGFSFEVRDPEGMLIHSEAWSRGSFTSDLHCLLTMALVLRRALGPSDENP